MKINCICGAELRVAEFPNGDIEVDPCPDCMAEEYNAGYETGFSVGGEDGYHAGYDDGMISVKERLSKLYATLLTH